MINIKLIKKNLIYPCLFLLFFLIAFQNYYGVLSHYIFEYEYIVNPNIFSENKWTEYIANSTQFLPLRFLNNLGIKINNDFHLFGIYFFNGLISIYFLNKIILEFFEIKDFYIRLIMVFCTAFANFIIFESIFSSTYMSFISLQTAIATQLIYPFFYTILSQRFFVASIVSSLLMFIHFTIAWFPTLIFSIFFIYKKKFKSFKIGYLFIPIITFLLLYYLNIDNFAEDKTTSIAIIEMILNRAEEESVFFLQPVNRIFYFISSLFIFFYIKKKIIKNNELSIFLSIIFYLCIASTVLGAFWTGVGYKYFPIKPFAYLYFVRSVLSYHIFFILLVTYFILINKYSYIKKTTFLLIIYILGKTFFSFKGILISLILIVISFIIEKLLKKYNKKINLNLKNFFYFLILFIFSTQIYLINKNNYQLFDKWSLNNLNDWTQHNTVFSNKSNNYKDNIFKLRKCKDFTLIPLIMLNGTLHYDNYINFLAHKSIYVMDSTVFFYSYDEANKNINKIKIKNQIIKTIKNGKNIDEIINNENLNDTVFLLDYSVYEKYTDIHKENKRNIIKINKDFIFYSNNKNIISGIKNCY
jgi:hypothetical protein